VIGAFALIPSTVFASPFITFNPAENSVSGSLPEGTPLTDALKDIGQAAGVKVSLEQYLTTPNNTVKAVSFEAVPLEKAIAQIVSPHYFKLFVYAAENADKNVKPAPVSLVVYRIWKNNEPQTVIYEPPTKTRSEIEANARIIGGDGRLRDSQTFKEGEQPPWDPGDATELFYVGKEKQFQCQDNNSLLYPYNYWINIDKNKELENIQSLKNFNDFVYVLGRGDNTSTSAIARAEFVTVNLSKACGGPTSGTAQIEGFKFYVIQGQIKIEIGELHQSEIEFFTKLPSYDPTGKQFAMKMNSDTLPDYANSDPVSQKQFESLKTKFPTQNSPNYDNVLYQEYKDDFLVKDYGQSSSQSLDKLLPSHMLYSPEDYVWDSTRLRLVPNGSEESQPFKDAQRNNEGTIGKMFKDNSANRPADSSRTPIIFIHGWQGDRSDAFSILLDYDKDGKGSDSPSSAEAYWRNLLTYMYKYHGEDFKKFKPYVYHYPTYKHINFNARMLKDLIDELKGKDDCLRNGYDNGKIIIIAHSMGTLVSRDLMENYTYKDQHNQDKLMLDKVQKFISLAGVHHGSPGAIASLVDTSILAERVQGKDVYTPGACDLMPDNYDGLINNATANDVAVNNWLAKELLLQRNAVGSAVLTVGSGFMANIKSKIYDEKSQYFDYYYIQQLGIKPSYIPDIGDEAKVPVISNYWLSWLNKFFDTSKKDMAKDKYIFYTGFVVKKAAFSVNGNLPPFGTWNNTLKDTTASFDQAARYIGEATGVSLLPPSEVALDYQVANGYQFNDCVVPVSSGILDFKRGNRMEATITSSDKLNSEYSWDLPNYIKMDDLKKNYVYRSENDWKAKIRIIYDYHHDRMLSGGYGNGDIDDFNYRRNKTAGAFSDDGIGFISSAFFLEYYKSVHFPDATAEMKFENDPLFEQIRMDILNFNECSEISKSECDNVFKVAFSDLYAEPISILSNGQILSQWLKASPPGLAKAVDRGGWAENEGRLRLTLKDATKMPFGDLDKEIDIIWLTDSPNQNTHLGGTGKITGIIAAPKSIIDEYLKEGGVGVFEFPKAFYQDANNKPYLMVKGGHFTTDNSNKAVFIRDTQHFIDVPADHKYYASVMWGANTDTVTRDNPIKILMGYSDQYFRPEEKISRAELLKYVMLAAGIGKLDAASMPTSDTDRFNDDPGKGKGTAYKYELALDGKDWAWAFIYSAGVPKGSTKVSLGIINGYPDGEFKPQNIINVAEATKIIVKSFKLESKFEDASKAWPETYRKFWEGDASVHTGYPVFGEISPLTSSADWGKFPTRAQLVDMVRFAYDKSTTKPVTIATTEKELVCPVLDKDNPITYGDADITVRFSSAVTESIASAGVKLYVETSPSRKLLKNITFVSKGLGQYELTVEKPTDLASGDYDLTLEVYGEKAVSPTTPPTPLKLKVGTGMGSGNASVLVLDVSGSMDSYIPDGTVKKIDVSKAAAKYYISLVGNGSYLGIIVFSDTDSTYTSPYVMKDITALTAGNRQEFIDQIDKITASKNSACPSCGGGTNLTSGIGAGAANKASKGARFLLDKVAGQVSSSTIVMLTDGKGTWDTTLEQTLKAENRVVHTIGLGSDVDSKLLEAIASNTNGTYHYIADSSESELSKAFGQVADTAAGRSGLGVGSITLTPGKAAEKIFRIDSSITDDVYVQVNSDIPADKLSVSLQMPDGSIIKIYKDKPNPYGITLSQSGNSLSFNIPNGKPGEWKVMLQSDTATKADFTISAKSSISVKAGLDNSGYKVGDKGKLYTAISAGKAVSGVKVRAKVSYTAVKTTRSDSSAQTEEWVELYDDGQHGDGAANDGVYGGYYTFKGTGEHNVVVYADGYTENSDQFTREFKVPAVSVAAMVDKDEDGMPDAWEELNGLHPNGIHPLNSNPGAVDTDGDGLTDLQEFQKGTVPYIADTDGDGINDGDEANKYHTNPTMTDTDGGGTPDNVEIDQKKNPNDSKDEAAFYDVNHDSKVTDADLMDIIRIWNTCVGDTRYNQALDFNHNGCIDVWDVMAVIVQMQATN